MVVCNVFMYVWDFACADSIKKNDINHFSCSSGRCDFYLALLAQDYNFLQFSLTAFKVLKILVVDIYLLLGYQSNS